VSLFAELLSTIFERRAGSQLPSLTDSRPIEQLAEALIGSEGEITGLALAADILTKYNGMSDEQKTAFFQHLASAMNINPHKVRQTLQAYEKSPTKRTYREFLSTAEPMRQELISRLNQVPIPSLKHWTWISSICFRHGSIVVF